jgi:uncharacterized membrane protein YheB (UPF0754 family)
MWSQEGAVMPRRSTKTRKSTDMVQVNLRIRESLRLRIEAAAKANNNSLNDELGERLELSFKNEDQAPQIKTLTDMLDAMVRKQKREGRVMAGFFENEMRRLGVDEKIANKMAEIARAYLGGEGSLTSEH